MKSKGEIDYGRLNFSIVVFILLILGANELYNRAFNQAYLQIDNLVIYIIYLLIAFRLCIKGLKELRTVDIYEEKFTLKYLGIPLRIIPFTKIIAYSVFTDDKIQFLKFATSRNTYLINRNLLSNEHELMQALKSSQNKKDQKLNYEEYKKNKKRETLLLGLTGFMLLVFSILHFVFQPHSVAKRTELVSISGNLKGAFEIHKPSKSPARYITFEITQNEEFSFRIGPGYDKINLKKIKQFMPNDTLRMLIESEDFESKIEKNKTPSFMRSHFKWEDINVYELYVNNKRILSANDYYAEQSENEKSNSFWAPVMGIAGLIILTQAKKAYR